MNNGPFPIEDFLASLTDALKIHGDARSIAILIEAECRFELTGSDWGIDYWSLRVGLPIQIFHALTEAEISEVEESLLLVARSFFSSLEADSLSLVKIRSFSIRPWRGCNQSGASSQRQHRFKAASWLVISFAGGSPVVRSHDPSKTGSCSLTRFCSDRT
jgi:hypothetical protein